VRLVAVAAAACFLAAAFAIRAVDDGLLRQYSGTALYASMVYAGVVFIRPRVTPVIAGAVAIGFCWAVEGFQVTGIPATLSAHSVAARLALGVTFDWIDILWYPAGVVPLVLLDLALRHREERP